MKKNLLNIANALLAGLAGAALFFIGAYYLHWGGINQRPAAATVQTAAPAATTPSQSLPVASGAQLSPEQIYQKYADSAVQIVSTYNNSGADFFQPSSGSEAIGSGFVTSSDGYILTNAHVVVDYNSQPPVKASKVEVNFRNGKKVSATIVGYDLTSSDIAVLKVDPTGLNLVPAVLGDSDNVIVGEPVVAIGSPFGQYSSSMTAGIVSATNRSVDSPEQGFTIQNAIQTDAAINSGNSGGPLFDGRGEVIGLNEQIATTSGGNEGVGFAVPINTAKQVMNQIITKGSVDYAWLGVMGQTVDSDTQQSLNLSVGKGALISDVESGGPAEAAGIKKNDVIVKVDGQDIAKMEDLTGILMNHKPGDKIHVTYVRGKDTKETDITLGKRPQKF